MSGIVSKVLKCLFFPVSWAFLGWLIVVHLGLEGLGVFCVSCVCFSFLCCFCSVLFALFLVLWLDVVVLFFLCPFCCFLFCFFVLFFVLLFCFVVLFCFFGGFKGQVRWPFGPPHLTLNPPYFVFFVFPFVLFSFLFFLFVFLEGWRVR